jgi:hypothetical protein
MYDNSKLLGKTVLEITSGYSHTCVRTNDSILFCWGGNTLFKNKIKYLIIINNCNKVWTIR